MATNKINSFSKDFCWKKKSSIKAYDYNNNAQTSVKKATFKIDPYSMENLRATNQSPPP